MVFDEAGTYQIEYTATDECGNTTNAERTVIVEAPPTYRTVLYTDGTFIINESDRDEAANLQAHGHPTNIYAPFDPNGAMSEDRYIFSSTSSRPWDSQESSILSVEIGSNISPTSMAYWFDGFSACTNMELSNIDTSLVTSMINTFCDCLVLSTLDLTNFKTASVIKMNSMFNGCEALASIEFGDDFDTSNVDAMDLMFFNCKALTSVDCSNFNTSKVKNMRNMFYNCFALTSVDTSGFDTGLVTNMSFMFYSCNSLTQLDLSSFNTSRVTKTEQMFRYCSAMTTIYASTDFVVSQVTNDANMFADMSSNLVGGAGTVWRSSYKSKTYARIDNPPDAPGLFTAKN